MQLNLFWILFIVFAILTVIAGLSNLGLTTFYSNNKILGLSSLTLFAIGSIGMVTVYGLATFGVLEFFENKEEKQSC